MWYALRQMKISYKKKPQAWREKNFSLDRLSSENTLSPQD
ncbi:MAG: hypothetical protein ACRYGR_08550 [Janthinobacterium lividum]